MSPDNERYLWENIRFCDEGPMPREVIARMVLSGMIKNPKQAWRTLEKWAGKHWYEYGVNIDLGWRTRRERV